MVGYGLFGLGRVTIGYGVGGLSVSDCSTWNILGHNRKPPALTVSGKGSLFLKKIFTVESVT